MKKMISSDQIESLLNEPYWIVDILPFQVPYQSEGQFFNIERFFLRPSQRKELNRKYLHLFLKLNCFYDVYVSYSNNQWKQNPTPESFSKRISTCMTKHETLYILFKKENSLITMNNDDTYVTIYNPKNNFIDLIQKIAISEGLFIWKPSF